ncbi:MAG: hypothetical protein HYV60_14765 [Planctomycetia bacterium]|nr:hypothetical protein [Planctomycetia bacterium]
MGAKIDRDTGVFTWTPTETLGLATFNITLRVTDDGTPMQSSLLQLSIEVNDDKPWQYFANPLDVNTGGFISPLDALVIINDLNANGARRLSVLPRATNPPSYIDVNGDGSVSPFDALVIINRLNASEIAAEMDSSA